MHQNGHDALKGNQTIDLLLARRSIRMFTGEPVAPEHLEVMLRAAQQAPTSINGQGISVIVVRDRETIAKVAEIAGGQRQIATADVFVCFVMDFHKTEVACARHGVDQEIVGDAEAVITGAVDVGLALASFQTAAHALGYGTTAIGGIRRDPAALVELLGLPEHTFPVAGSTVGVPDVDKLPRVKPRLPLEAFAMPERYDADAVEAGVDAYDATLRAWWDDQGLTQMDTYSGDVARLYGHVYYPEVTPTLHAQGFLTQE